MAVKQSSIKTEMTFFIVALMILVIGVLSYFVLQSQKNSLVTEVKLRGQSIAKNLAGSIADFILTEDELSISRIMSDVMNNKGVLYALITDEKSGVIRYSNNLEQNGSLYHEPAGFEELESGPDRIGVYSETGRGKVIDFTVPVIAKGKINLGTVRLGIAYSVIDNVLLAAYVKAGVISLISIILGIIGAFILGAAITKPIAVLADGAKMIGTGNLDHKITVKSKNELGALAAVFNMMTDNLKLAHETAIKQQRLEKELEVARDIQLSLIPKDIAKIPGYEINAYYRSAKEVGGDYYDVIPLNKEKFGLVMGDVSGKGVPAALIMTMARSTLHSEAREAFDKPSSETLKKLNAVLAADIKDGMFVTIFYGILDIKRNIVNIASAGHNDTLVYRRKNGDVLPYNPKGFPLGTDPGTRFDKVIKNEDVLLEKGDQMIIFTDGITEAMNEQHDEFGDVRLIEAIKNNGAKTGKAVLDAIIRDVGVFVKDAEQSDDIAVVVLTRV